MDLVPLAESNEAIWQFVIVCDLLHAETLGYFPYRLPGRIWRGFYFMFVTVSSLFKTYSWMKHGKAFWKLCAASHSISSGDMQSHERLIV
jgi:hypothetical protein